jgi:hypothetical protein
VFIGYLTGGYKRLGDAYVYNATYGVGDEGVQWDAAVRAAGGDIKGVLSGTLALPVGDTHVETEVRRVIEERIERLDGIAA